MRRNLLPALCAVSLFACVSVKLHKEGAWSESRTAHLLVRTDLDPAEATAMTEQLERLYLGLLQRWWPGAEQPGHPLEVVLVASDLEFRELAWSSIGGYYTRGVLGRNIVVTNAGASRFATRLNAQGPLKHELTHHLLDASTGAVPWWLNEGIATYMEGLEVDLDRNVIRIGKPSAIRMQSLAAGQWNQGSWYGSLTRWTPGQVREVIRKGGAKDVYSEDRAWAVFFHLANSHPEELDAYLRLLWTGEEGEEAFATAFARFPVETLAEEMTARYGGWSMPYTFKEIPLPVLTERARTQPMPAAAMHAQLAELGATAVAAWPHGAVEAEARHALAVEPANLKALGALARIGVHDAAFVQDCRAAVAAHPSDPAALEVLAVAMQDPALGSERREVLERAVALDPGNASLLDFLAREDVRAGRGDEALALAQKALGLSPADARFVDTFAAALAQSKRCADALAAQKEALKLLPGGAAPAGMKKRLAAYEGGCSSLPLD